MREFLQATVNEQGKFIGFLHGKSAKDIGQPNQFPLTRYGKIIIAQVRGEV